MGCCLGILDETRSSSGGRFTAFTNWKQKFFGDWERQWSSSAAEMETDANFLHSLNMHKSSVHSSTVENTTTEENINNHSFVNQGAITWKKMRSEWIGDQSKKSHRTPREPSISWSTSYDELLLTSKPFSEPIALSEMVDFLVDIWHVEGLYD